MTPYRYFEDKEDILAAVRTKGFNQFAESLERARDGATGARAKGAAVGDAYIDFALAHPHTYKLMFDLNQPDESRYPDLVQAGQRARATLTAWVKDLIADKVLAGDPDQIGTMFWTAAHGAIVLELAGKLPPGAARSLHHAMAQALGRGLRPEA